MNGIFCKLLTNYVLKRILPKGVSVDEYFESLIFPAKIQISKAVDVPYIRVYVWIKDDKHVIWTDVNMIDAEKYQPALQNMRFVTLSLRSLTIKLHILALQADIFDINQFPSR